MNFNLYTLRTTRHGGLSPQICQFQPRRPEEMKS